MRYKGRYTIIRQWIFLPLILSLLLSAFIEVPLKFFGFEHDLNQKVIIFLTISTIFVVIAYYLNRSLKYVDLAENGITLAYHKNADFKDKVIPAQRIERIAIYSSSRFNEADYYHIHTVDDEIFYFDSHFVSIKQLLDFCAFSNIKIEEKQSTTKAKKNAL